MATVVQSAPAVQNPRMRLAVASLMGALLVLVGVAAAVVLNSEVANRFFPRPEAGKSDANFYFRLVLQVFVLLGSVVAVVWAGTRMVASPPRGLRGGVFLAVVGLVVSSLIAKWVGASLEAAEVSSGVGVGITLVVLAALLFGTFRLLVSPRVQSWMEGIEDLGWYHGFHYKRSQGQKIRRYTLIGILLIGLTGVGSLYRYVTLGSGEWSIAIPYVKNAFTILSDIEYTLPLLLAGIVLWLAWRTVNMPPFADFLIATEAEMNKVSWPTRKGLVQDTIVVLITTLIITLFLLVMDVFWGWLLSMVGVLPSRAAPTNANNPIQGRIQW